MAGQGAIILFFLLILILFTRVKRERYRNQQLHDEGKVPTNYLEISLYDPKYAKPKKKSEYSNC